MNHPDMFNNTISPIVKSNYQRILSRIADLSRYQVLQPLIVDFLENPLLTVVDECWGACGEKLKNAGFISDVHSFLEYRTLITATKRPLSFLTAPGSRMNDHHSYPGGLVLHTATDPEMALSMADVYQKIYNLSIDKEVIIMALTLHDIAKVNVYPWDDQGEYPDEIQIAGTGSHHILSISEAIVRGLPLPVIKAMAFCHNRIVLPETGLKRFLKAAYLLAGRQYPEGVETQITIEDWLCLLADSDWPISSWAMKQSINQHLSDMPRSEFLNFLSHKSEFHIFHSDSK